MLVIGKSGSVAQRLRGRYEPLLVFDMIRNTDELSALPFDDCPWIVDLGFPGRMRRDVVFDFLASDAGGIESVSRLVASVGEERLVAFQQIVAIAVDQQIVMDLLLGRPGTI